MKSLLIGLLAIPVLLFAGDIFAQTEIQIEGSTTVGPIVDAFVNAFAEKNSELKFSVKKTGSGDGIAALIDGRCEIATSSRFLKPDEFQKMAAAQKMPVPFPICMDGVCIIVHPANPVKDLSQQQLKKIYTGEFTNWKELGGSDSPILAISRDTSSGTYEVFHQIVIGTDKLGAKVEFANSNPQIFTRVSTTPAAIGFVGLGFVKNGVKSVRYEGIVPSRESIISGKYKISRPLFLFTNGYPEMGSPLLDFCNFYLSENGHEIIKAKGFVPVTNY